MDGVAMEGPVPPLMKIDDDVEGVEGEGLLTLKSMRRGRSCEGRVCEVCRFERVGSHCSWANPGCKSSIPAARIRGFDFLHRY